MLYRCPLMVLSVEPLNGEKGILTGTGPFSRSLPASAKDAECLCLFQSVPTETSDVTTPRLDHLALLQCGRFNGIVQTMN